MTERTLTAKAIVHSSVHWFSLGLVIPVFAAFQLDRGLSLSGLGLNLAILSAVVAAMELPPGGLADSFGRRNTYLLSIGAQLLPGGSASRRARVSAPVALRTNR